MKAKIKSQAEEIRKNLVEEIPLPSPYVLYIEPSGYCNLKCKFCPHFLSPEDLIKNWLSDETIKALITQCNEFGTIEVIRLIGTGEPLLHPNILGIVKKIRLSGVCKRLEMTTNGILLNRLADIKQLTSYLDRIVISIEGLTDQEYLRVTGKVVCVNKLIDGLKVLYKNKGNCKVYVKIHNNAVKCQKDKNLFFQTFGDLCDEIYIENLVNLWPEHISDLGSDSQHRFGGGIDNRQVCTQIFKTLLVYANGDVVPCCVDFKRCHLLGNIHDVTLRDIWNGRVIQTLRMNHLKGRKKFIKACSSCEFYKSDMDSLDNHSRYLISKLKLCE